METPTQPAQEEEIEEISVDVTEEGQVWLHGRDWELLMSPEEARLLGESLLDAADDAEEATE
ncbi:MAG: hypothetical protein HY320_13370 [Armatimonadetes bacterium]|nr:hypothetical protein [Armatimonadota bacterium]